MAKSLVIVESPTKAKTISRFLGSDFVIESSYGHIRDLPAYKLGVDVEKDFEPQYVISRKSQPKVKKLKEEAKKADKIILATDEDREGEAIAWHLVHALGLNKPATGDPQPTTERIVFHEITKKAIEEALKNPRHIDEKLVNAQQARRILDRLVGYQLSPFLWKKITRGLSAGRVQSVAVRLIVEREREIKQFKAEEYWSIEALLKQRGKTETDTQNNVENIFPAVLIKIGDKTLDKFAIKNGEEAQKVIGDISDSQWKILSVEKRAVTKRPSPPFTTSTLQQEAWRRLRFSAKQTMLIAQQLYEGIELGEGPVGLITYMRTDSVNLSEESLRTAKEYIETVLGKKYGLPVPKRFKTKSKGAQEAHEAVRPTDPQKNPEMIKSYLNRNQYRLYDLIWRRFIATQMADAILNSTTADIETIKTGIEPHIFRAHGQIMQFDGFLKIYPLKIEEVILPELSKEEKLELKEVKPFQHFTEPPPRFTEASLVKTLEKFGIGRPSTYAPIMSTIQDRGYVIKNPEKRFEPTDIGYVVNDMLVKHFPVVVDIQFTAKMEEELDEIAEGKKEWRPLIKEFYEPFAKNLSEKFEEVVKQVPEETTSEICEKCGKPMIVRFGRFGKFLACSGFPECKSTKSLKARESAQTLDMACPKCVEGQVIIKKTRRGKIFFGCSRYPDCNFASWGKPIGEKCPKCGNPLIEDNKKGIKCNSKECDYRVKAAQSESAEQEKKETE